MGTPSEEQRHQSRFEARRTEAEIDALLSELRALVDAVATLERTGARSNQIARERTGISRLRNRIAALAKRSAGDSDSAA